jgi:chemotaxis protein methyltransferase CheR
MVTFETANLARAAPELWRRDAFDLVFCRNVLIYFGVEEGLAVVRVLLERLKPHGALVVAPTEAVVRASWRRPEADAPIGWFVPDRGELPLTARPAPPSPGRSPSSDRPARTELEASLGASEARLEEAARRLSTGEVADAELLLGELLDGDPEHAEGWFLLGEALFSRGELAQARAAFLRASRATRHGRVDAQTLRDAASRRAEACVRR